MCCALRNMVCGCCRSRLALIRWALCLSVLTSAGATGGAEPSARLRYAAAWEDGTFSWGTEVGPWHETQAQPRVSGRLLFGPPAPIRWLLDTQLAPAAPPQAFVELIGGDRVPGRVIGLRGEADSAGQGLPPHLLVIPAKPVEKAGVPAREGLRILLRWVRRVVCQPAASRYQPSTLFLRDGRQLSFRTLRVVENAVRTLTAEGIVETPLSSIAEWHLPAADDWDAYYEELALLSPDATARLVQLETDSGLKVTGSTALFQAEVAGKAADAARWQHMLQPAWSPDPLWLFHGQIRVRRYFDATRVPLSRLLPVAATQRSEFGASWSWQADSNVEGGPLRSAGRLFQWGFGVHARCELEFVVPPAAEAFRTSFGLDDVVGGGGCVRPSVRLLAPANKPLFDGAVMVGSASIADTGALWIDRPANAPARLALLVDAAHDARPPGADPFDIRDHFDWLEPELLLNRAALLAQVFQRAKPVVPAWRDWDVSTGGQPGARLQSYWDPDASAGPRYRFAATTQGSPLTLTRRVEVSERNDQLQLRLRRPITAPPCSLAIEVDGRRLQQIAIPADANPFWIALTEFRGRTVTITLVQSGEGQPSWVEWLSVTLGAKPPSHE